MEASNQIGDRAIALASGGDRQGAVDELIRLADGRPGPLDRAREELVRRIRLRSDDYGATRGLTLLNSAIASVGWPADITWMPRKWRLRR